MDWHSCGTARDPVIVGERTALDAGQARESGRLRRRPGRRLSHERAIGPGRERLEQGALLAFEAGFGRFAEGAVEPAVGGVGEPGMRLGVEVVVVQELPRLEDALAHVTDRPLDLALGPGAIGSAGADAKAPVRSNSGSHAT